MDFARSDGINTHLVSLHFGLRCALVAMIAGPGAVCAFPQCAEQQKLTASDAGGSDQFGLSVSVNGDTVLVGAGTDDCAAGRCGSAYVFQCLPDCIPSSPPTLQTQFDPGSAPEPKNRYLAVTAGDVGQLQTIRVTWETMPNWPGGHTALEGQQKWLLEPFQVCENSGQAHGPPCGISPGQPQKWFWAARLACDVSQAWYGDLSNLSNYCARSGEPCTTNADCSVGTCGVDGVLHLVDQGIVPSKRTPAQSAVYTVQVLDSTCSSAVPNNYSDPLVVTNPLYGDVLLNNGACPTGPPNNNPDISDVLGVLSKFSNAPCAPKKTRADMQPATPDLKVGIPDVLQALNGYGGLTYLFPAGDACPASREP